MRNMQGLVSFVDTAIAGSFSAAADRLSITPAAVGKNVARLEKELGVRLFQRTTRRVALTAEGEAFFEQASEALQQLDRAVDDVKAFADAPKGLVRISCGMAFGRRFVLPLLPKLAQRHPQLDVELGLENRPVDLIDAGIDIAIRGGIAGAPGVVARPLGALAMVLVASPGYLRKFGVPRAAGDLRQHHLLGTRFASGEVAPWSFRRHTGLPGAAWLPSARVWTSDPDAALDVAAAGEGICQAALMHAAPLLRSGRLQLVLNDHVDHGTRQMQVCYAHRSVSKRVRVVVDALMGLSAHADLTLDPRSAPKDWIAL